MQKNYEKRHELAWRTKTTQTLRRIRRGIGAIRKSLAKQLVLLTFWMVLLTFWALRYPIMGYTAESLLAWLQDFMLGLNLVVLTVAVPIALAWAWGGPWQAGSIQDNLLRIGLVNAAGEPPTLISSTPHLDNPNILTYAFFTCGIPVSVWLDCADKIQSALNRTIADIRYGADNQSVLLSVAPPATQWPSDLLWVDHYQPLEPFILTLGKSPLGLVTVDLKATPHILLGGTTGSGKTVLLKEFAAVLHVSMNTAYELVRGGKIKSIRIGHQFRITKAALDEYMAAC